MRRRFAHALIISALLPLTTGCASNKLETGYTYRPLNSTATQREAYYAGPFSREQIRLQQETGIDRRPDSFR